MNNADRLSTLRTDYRAAVTEAALCRTEEDFRSLLAFGYQRGGRVLRVARMVEKLLRRRDLHAAAFAA